MFRRDGEEGNYVYTRVTLDNIDNFADWTRLYEESAPRSENRLDRYLEGEMFMFSNGFYKKSPDDQRVLLKITQLPRAPVLRLKKNKTNKSTKKLAKKTVKKSTNKTKSNYPK